MGNLKYGQSTCKEDIVQLRSENQYIVYLLLNDIYLIEYKRYSYSYIFSYFYSVTGRAWSAATTEGLLTYSLDVAMVFDPYDLALDVTPEGIKHALEKREFTKALVLSFRLNEKDVILQVVESIPSQDSEYISLFRINTVTSVLQVVWIFARWTTIQEFALPTV